MKITRDQLKRIVLEEIKAVLDEVKPRVARLNRNIEKGLENYALNMAGPDAADGDLKAWDIVAPDGSFFARNVSYNEAMEMLEPYEWVAQSTHGLQNFRITGMKEGNY